MKTPALRTSRPPEPPGARTVRFGTAVGLGAAASIACSLPAALRIAPWVANTDGLPQVWVATAAAAFGPMIAAVVVLRGAREGLRAYSGEATGLRIFGIALWLASLLVAFAVFGGILRATTHQHALAGVTFAFGSAAVAFSSALVCARLVAILSGVPVGPRVAIGISIALVGLAALCWVGVRFLRDTSQDPASAAAAATVVDVLAFALAALFAARPTLASRRAFALVGPPIAIVVVALGASTLRDAPLRDAIQERAPVFSLVADLVPGP